MVQSMTRMKWRIAGKTLSEKGPPLYAEQVECLCIKNLILQSEERPSDISPENPQFLQSTLNV